jgi:hypothetical protein
LRHAGCGALGDAIDLVVPFLNPFFSVFVSTNVRR